ncbi:HIT family protein [Patescibacteria group bacterium]|nr:HIT family protein [Patescibacteria group bacterium]
MTQQIKNKLNPEAFNIGINMGKKAGQVVDHLHVHIIPRWQNDGGKSVNSIVNNPPKENLEDILERIVGTGL